MPSSRTPWYVTPARFRTMRRKLHCSPERIATWFGVTPYTVLAWEQGSIAIPGAAKILMWLLYKEQIDRNPNALRQYALQIKKARTSRSDAAGAP